jgi:hypothetical protein
MIEGRISPENISRHPVNSQSFRRLDFRSRKAASVGAVVIRAANVFSIDVAPVDSAIMTVDINTWITFRNN